MFCIKDIPLPIREGIFPYFLKSGQLLTGLTKAWLGSFGEIGHPSEGASIPSGIITMWSGLSTAIPTGWLLCDGNNGTPDLRNKFVLGAGGNYAVGATGGEATHTLTINEMPSHAHGIYRAYSYGNEGNTSCFGNDGRFAYTTNTAGGGQAHNNMPPYYALCFIMKQ